MKQIFNNNENNAVKDRIFTPLYGVKLQDGLFCEVFHKNFEYFPVGVPAVRTAERRTQFFKLYAKFIFHK